MYNWIAKYRRFDDPYGEELRLYIDGTEDGFQVFSEGGETLPVGSFFTEDDAIEALRDYADRMETFEWL